MALELKMFLWKAAQDSLPTGENLTRRGVSSNTNCIQCNCQEITLHALFHCRFAQEVWTLGPWEDYLDYNALNSFRALLVGSQRKKNLPPYGVSINLWLCWSICWSIWCTRNQLLFQNRIYHHRRPSTKQSIQLRSCPKT